jgi:hypothetical protein
LQLLLEPAVEFDACPVLFLHALGLAHDGQHLADKTRYLQFAGAARTGLGNQPVNAARVEELKSTQELALTPSAQADDAFPRLFAIQLGEGLQPDEDFFGRRTIHRALDLFERGVLAMALQPKPSHPTKLCTLPLKVYALFRHSFCSTL